MRKLALPLVILGCIALAALLTWIVVSTAVFGGHDSRGDNAGSRVAATQSLPPFTRLDIAGSAEVTLVQGSEEGLSLPAMPAKAGAHVSAEVRNGTLFIKAVDRARWWDMIIGGASRPAPVVVSFKKLDAIATAGTVRVSAESLEAGDLEVTGTGGTTIRIDDLRAQRLRLSGAGALRADIAGRVDRQDLSISGAGEFRGGKLVSRDATVNVAGAGKVVVNAEQTLNATISGAGSVEYIGDPKVVERISGVGRVRRRESAAFAPQPA